MHYRCKLKASALVFTVNLLTWTASVHAEDDYILGHGLNVGDVNFAGYSSIAADAPLGQRKDISIDDLSLFVTGHVNRWINPFTEIELANQPILQTPDANGGLRARTVLERLYDDIFLTDDLTLRGGKMLAPVGEWNSIHAAPLVPTSTRPMATYYGFSEFITGMSVMYSKDDFPLPDIQVYWQPAGELAQRNRDLTVRNYRDVSGIHFSWPFGLTDKIGTSLQHSSIESTGEKQTVAGLNGNYKFGRFSVETEATYTWIDKGSLPSTHSEEWGGYVLGAYALTETISIFTWYETFQTRYDTTPAQDVLFGTSWHPSPPIVWKLEYVGSVSGPSDTNRTGFFGSFSVLY